jgi:hypothetical protein
MEHLNISIALTLQFCGKAYMVLFHPLPIVRPSTIAQHMES